MTRERERDRELSEFYQSVPVSAVVLTSSVRIKIEKAQAISFRHNFKINFVGFKIQI